MKNIVYRGFLCTGLLFFASTGCKKSEIPLYDNQYDAVRYAWQEEGNKEEKGIDLDMQIFRASYSFISTPDAESYDYQLPVELIGHIADKDRVVAYKVDKEKTTAPDGSYEILGAHIPAGKRSGKLTVKLKNSDALRSEDYRLYIQLVKSDDLEAGPRVANMAELLWTRRVLPPTFPIFFRTYNALINSRLSWNSQEKDCFSFKALEVIVQALDWTDWGDTKKHGNKGNGPRYNNYNYLPRPDVIVSGDFHKGYALKLKAYIDQYNEKHPNDPLIHDGGELEGKPIEVRNY